MAAGGAPLFRVEQSESSGNHSYFVVGAHAPDRLHTDLVAAVEASYFGELSPREVIEQACAELSRFDGDRYLPPSETEIDDAIAAEIDARIPRAWSAKSDQPKHLSTQRSELAEIIASEVLSSIFGTTIPASRVMHKEIPDQPTRGADIIGLEGGASLDCTIVLVEVKGSTDAKSPPGVVDGMVEKLGQLVSDRRNLHQELIWLREHCAPEHTEHLMALCVQFAMRKERFTILLCPVLLRPRGLSRPSDSGVFRSDPDSLGHTVRWASVVIDDDLFDFAHKVYGLVRQRADQ